MSTIKKRLALLAALALAAVLSVALATPALASMNPSSATVTITGMETNTTTTPTVNAYKIIEVNWDDTNSQYKTPQYKWNSTIAAWLRSNTTYSKYVNTSDDGVTSYFDSTATGYNETEAKALLSDLRAEFMKGSSGAFSSITATATATPSDGTATFSDLAIGGYLFSVEGATSRVYQVMTANVTPVQSSDGTWKATASPASISSKGKDVSVDKQIKIGESDVKTASVNVGDTVSYEAKVVIPDYPSNATYKTFTFKDTMDTALTYDSSSLKIYFSSDGTTWGDPIESTATGYPTVSSGTNTFTLTFDQSKLTSYSYVKVAYSATVNSNITSKIGSGGALNDAEIGFKNNPYTDSDYKTVDDPNPPKVFTYGIIITKTDNTAEKNALAGATFEVYSDSEMKNKLSFVKVSDGVYRIAGKNETETTVTTVTVGTGETGGGEKGVLKIQGISGSSTGTSYYLKETIAPSGYVLADETKPVQVKISTDSSGQLTSLLTGQTEDTTNKGYVAESIENVKSGSFTLPSTGDVGTIMLTAVGVAIMAGGVFVVARAVRGRQS